MAQALRILSIDATALSDTTDMAILKSHIFGAWPRESLAQLIVGKMHTDLARCSTNWRITREDMTTGRDGCIVAPTEGDTVPAVPATPRPGLRAALASASQPLRYAISDRAMCRASALNRPMLMSWVRDFRPDLVFTFGASATICRMATEISEERKVPVLPFFTDDWVSWLYAQAPMRQIARAPLDRWFARMMKRAPLSLTICETMARTYAERYPTRFEACMDSVDLARYPAERIGVDKGETVTFAFVGVLAPKRWKTLKWVADAVEALRRAGHRCRFLIYTMPADVQKFGPILNLSEDVRIVGTAPYSNVPEIQMRADVLVHAEGFLAERDIAKVSLSLSTKIPQYLAAGRPILAVGPAGIASVEYLRSTGAAVVVDSPDPSRVAQAVERLTADGRARALLGEQARRVCEQNHSRSAMNARFATAVQDAVRIFRDRGTQANEVAS